MSNLRNGSKGDSNPGSLLIASPAFRVYLSVCLSVCLFVGYAICVCVSVYVPVYVSLAVYMYKF